MSLLLKTLGDAQWVLDHEKAIKELLPQTWTHMENIDMMKLGFRLKLLGIDWRSELELAKCLVFFEKIGFMIRDGYTVRAKP